MDLKNMCKHIYYAVVTSAGNFTSPIAYVNVRVGRKFPFSDEEFLSAFKKATWDTVISTADLNIIRDANYEGLARIEEISDFFDEDGKCNVFTVPDEDAVL